MLKLAFIVFACKMPAAQIKSGHIRTFSETEQHIHINAHYENLVLHGIEVESKKTNFAVSMNEHNIKVKFSIKL